MPRSPDGVELALDLFNKGNKRLFIEFSMDVSINWNPCNLQPYIFRPDAKFIDNITEGSGKIMEIHLDLDEYNYETMHDFIYQKIMEKNQD